MDIITRIKTHYRDYNRNNSPAQKELWIETLLKMLNVVIGDNNEQLYFIKKNTWMFCYYPGSYGEFINGDVESNIIPLIENLINLAESKFYAKDEIIRENEELIELYNPEYKIAIITATPFEFEAVKNILQSPQKKSSKINNDSNLYYSGVIKNDNASKETKVLLTQCPSMGISSATSTATKLILNFRPEYIFMVGIAAGIKKG